MLTSDPLTDSIRDLWYYDCNVLDSIGFVSNLTPSCQLAMTHQTYMSYFCYYTCNRLRYQTYAESHWMLEAFRATLLHSEAEATKMSGTKDG